MGAASWTFTTVMEMMTVGTGRMNLTAPLTSHAALESSCATVACVSMLAGDVMATLTVMTSQMRRTALHLCAQLTSSAVSLADVSASLGAAIGRMIALTIAMRKTVRTQEVLSVPLINFSVGMGAALAKENCAMVQMTVEMAVMKVPSRIAVLELGKKTATSAMGAVPRSAR